MNMDKALAATVGILALDFSWFSSVCTHNCQTSAYIR